MTKQTASEALRALFPTLVERRDWTLKDDGTIDQWKAPARFVKPTDAQIVDKVASLAAIVPAPQTLTPAQLRLQLAVDGKQSADVEAIISHLPEPLKTQATIMFEYSLQFDRADPRLIQIAAAIGYDTPAKLDAFFIAAGKL